MRRTESPDDEERRVDIAPCALHFRTHGSHTLRGPLSLIVHDIRSLIQRARVDIARAGISRIMVDPRQAGFGIGAIAESNRARRIVDVRALDPDLAPGRDILLCACLLYTSPSP